MIDVRQADEDAGRSRGNFDFPPKLLPALFISNLEATGGLRALAPEKIESEEG